MTNVNISSMKILSSLIEVKQKTKTDWLTNCVEFFFFLGNVSIQVYKFFSMSFV